MVTNHSPNDETQTQDKERNEVWKTHKPVQEDHAGHAWKKTGKMHIWLVTESKAYLGA